MLLGLLRAFLSLGALGDQCWLRLIYPNRQNHDQEVSADPRVTVEINQSVSEWQELLLNSI